MNEYKLRYTVAVPLAKQIIVDIFDTQRRRGTADHSCRRNPASFMNTMLLLGRIGSVDISFERVTGGITAPNGFVKRFVTYQEQWLVDIAQLLPEFYIGYLDRLQDVSGIPAAKLKTFFKEHFICDFWRKSGTKVKALIEKMLDNCLRDLKNEADSCPSFTLSRCYGRVGINCEHFRLSVADRKAIAKCLVILCESLNRRVVAEYRKKYAWREYWKSEQAYEEPDKSAVVDMSRIERLEKSLGMKTYQH